MTTLRRWIIFFTLGLVGLVRSVLMHSEKAYRLFFLPGLEGFRWRLGKWGVWYVYQQARVNTPAYKDFISHAPNPGVDLHTFDPNYDRIPIMDKESYIKKYSIEERCVGGRLPTRGVVIDESSGTSGTPNNWIRGPEERKSVKRALQISFHYLFGKEPIFVLNAFALGPWATGMNVSMSMVDVTILKSVGPEIQKIVNTLKTFGPKYKYMIMGYPPFLKTLIDSAEIDWKEYNISAVFGGEGISEGMRTYLGRAFNSIVGSYGASDLEINIAAENEFTIALRRKIMEEPKLHKSLIPFDDGVLPMIFQYNPIDYYIEHNAEYELLVTLCRASNTCPKIRYNIHDRGHVVRYPELVAALQGIGITPKDFNIFHTDLPLLFHYGRADMAVAFYGCKITPTNIEEIIFGSDLAKDVNSFSLLISEDEQANKHLTLALEMREHVAVPESRTQEYRAMIFEELKKINQDYREASRMIPKGSEPNVSLHAFGSGPFAGGDIRIKKKYIQQTNA